MTDESEVDTERGAQVRFGILAAMLLVLGAYVFISNLKVSLPSTGILIGSALFLASGLVFALLTVLLDRAPKPDDEEKLSGESS